MSAAALGLTDVDDTLKLELAQGLDRVNALLSELVDVEDPFVAEASGHLLAAGGKRSRPLLSLLAAQLGPRGITDDVVTAAAAVELIHLASLYHDDVMDEADQRRGAQSANARYGNSTAILVGDLLFGTASSLVAGLGPEAVKIQADAFVRLCAGQIRDARPTPSGVDPVEYYLGVLSDKTSVLLATAARFGAMFSGADAATVEVLRVFGERFGVAFQLADDILDIASTSDVSGKQAGTDLREGVDTLPILYVRAGRDPADAELLELLDSDLREPVAHARALELLRAHPALERARAYTRGVAAEAEHVVEQLPDGPATRALGRMAADTASRLA